MEKIKTAVVGVGMFGDTHARTFKESATAELVWVCDLNEARAKEAADKYGCKYTTHLEDIANDPGVRVVGIATPDFAHRDASLLMIDAGKDLLIEKPLATTIEDAEAITNAAKKRGIRMMTDFQNRWNPTFVQAKMALESGELGFPVSAYTCLSNSIQINEWLSWTAKSGPQWFLGPHIVDLVRWLFGQEAKKVFAVGRREILKGIGFDTYDAYQAQIIFEDAFATVESSWIVPPTWPGLDFRMEMQTSKGKLRLEPTAPGFTISTNTQFKWPFIGGRQDAYGKMFGFFREPILHFIDCVREDAPCLVDIEDGLKVTKIICAIEESIQTGQVVDI